MVGMDRETTLTFPLPESFLKRYAVNIYSSSLYNKLRLQANIQPNTRVLWYPAYIFDGDEKPVFHVGEHYLSVDQFDRVTGRITLKERLASEYARTELVKGAKLADFTFIDLEGRNGRLSEFHGKYLLLDFWGTWCSGCREEMPFYKKAYEKYRGRGFEILGIDAEETKDRLAEFVLKNGITWRQATAESTEELLRKKLRIQDHGYPTRVLLDPQGKILSLGHDGELPLGGKDLIKTLETLLPKELAPAVQKQR